MCRDFNRNNGNNLNFWFISCVSCFVIFKEILDKFIKFFLTLICLWNLLGIFLFYWFIILISYFVSARDLWRLVYISIVYFYNLFYIITFNWISFPFLLLLLSERIGRSCCCCCCCRWRIFLVNEEVLFASFVVVVDEYELLNFGWMSFSYSHNE